VGDTAGGAVVNVAVGTDTVGAARVAVTGGTAAAVSTGVGVAGVLLQAVTFIKIIRVKKRYNRGMGLVSLHQAQNQIRKDWQLRNECRITNPGSFIDRWSFVWRNETLN
jgi:hypothetical protein